MDWLTKSLDYHRIRFNECNEDYILDVNWRLGTPIYNPVSDKEALDMFFNEFLYSFNNPNIKLSEAKYVHNEAEGTIEMRFNGTTMKKLIKLIKETIIDNPRCRFTVIGLYMEMDKSISLVANTIVLGEAPSEMIIIGPTD